MVAFFSKWLTANHLTTLRVALVPFYLPGYGIWERRSVYFVQHLAGLFICMPDRLLGWCLGPDIKDKQPNLANYLILLQTKFLIGSILVLLVGMGRAPALLAVILISREFIISGLRSIAAAEGVVISASSGGKLKTIFQMFAVGFLIIHYPTFSIPCHEVGIILLWISIAVSLWSGFNLRCGLFSCFPW